VDNGGGALAIGGAALFLFVLAYALRIAVCLDYEAHHPLADSPVIDERSYETWALEIAGGDWVGDEVFFQEPLYPYWLGGVYALAGAFAGEGEATQEQAAEPVDTLAFQRTGARHAQAFLGALTALLVFAITRSLFGPLAGWVAGLGAALHRPLLLLPALLLKPNLFLPLFALLVWLLLRARLGPPSPRRLGLFAAAGAVAGLAALLRGNALLLLPVFVALPFLRLLPRGGSEAGGGPREAAGASLALLAGIVAVLLPVALRNHAVGGVFALTTSGAGTNVYGGNSLANPYGRATEFDWVRGIPEHEADDWRREAERRTGASLDPGEVSSYWLGEAWRSVRAQPLAHARILWNKLRLSLGRYEVPDNHHVEWDARFLGILRLPIPGWGLWGWLGLAGLLWFAASSWVTRGEGGPERRSAIELALLFLLYLATIVLTVTSMRVRLALLVPLLPFAGSFVARLVAGLHGPAPPAAAARASLCLLVAAVPTFLPVLDAGERAQDLDKRDFNLAVHLVDRPGGLDEAERIAVGLSERYPGTSRLETLLAHVAYRRAQERLAGQHGSGDPRTEEDRVAAEELLREAMQRLRRVSTQAGVNARERFRARSLAGWVQLETGNGPAAESHFRAARAFDDEDRGLRLGLANALWLRAVDAPERSSDDVREALVESRALLQGLIEERDEPGLLERLAQVDAALADS